MHGHGHKQVTGAEGTSSRPAPELCNCEDPLAIRLQLAVVHGEEGGVVVLVHQAPSEPELACTISKCQQVAQAQGSFMCIPEHGLKETAHEQCWDLQASAMHNLAQAAGRSWLHATGLQLFTAYLPSKGSLMMLLQ